MSLLFYRSTDPREAMDRLVAMQRSNEAHAEGRRLQAAKYGSLYENMHLSGLTPYGYSSDSETYFEFERKNGSNIPLIRNEYRGIIDTFVSKIGALGAPMPTAMTTYGSWKDRRQARDIQRLATAEYHEPQGRFSTLHALYVHALRLSISATGAAAIKVNAYPNERKVCHEIHDTLTMFFDYGELTYGDLNTVGEITWFDVERAKELFTGAGQEEAIDKAKRKPPQEMRTPVETGLVHEMVPIYEGWRCTVGDQVGKYVCGVPDAPAFEFDDYPSTRLPFVMLVPFPHLYGPLGSPMGQWLFESIRRDNLILHQVDKAITRALRGLTFLDKDKLAIPDSLDNWEEGEVVDIKGGAAGVQHISPQGFHGSHLEVAEMHRRDTHALSGVPESASRATREQGLPSAEAQRHVSGQVIERFAAAQRAFVQAMAVDDAHLIVQAHREIRDKGGKFTRKMPGERFLREIRSDALDLDDSKFTLRFAPQGENVDSPAGRVQKAFELVQAGILSEDSLAEIQDGTDLPEMISDRDSQREWVEWQIDRWMFASDEEVEEPGFYMSPLKLMRLGPALSMVVDALMEAQVDDLEPERQEFFLLFLADLDAAVKAKAAYAREVTGGPQPAQAQPGAPAPAALPAPGPQPAQ